MIHCILFVQFTCLTVLFNNISPGPLWSWTLRYDTRCYFNVRSKADISQLYPLLHTPCISSPNHHHLFAAHAHTIAACSAVIPMPCHLYHTTTIVSLISLLGNLSFSLTRYNATHPPDHSQLCSLKCHLIFFPYRPGLTSMQHTASHATTVQPSSHNQ